MGPLAFGPQLMCQQGNKNLDLTESASLPWVTQISLGIENGQNLTMQLSLTFQE
jgi:hypothetical protein